MSDPVLEVDWTSNEDVAALIGAQLTAGIALLVNRGLDETDLINGFVVGRYGFHVTKDGVMVTVSPGKEEEE